MESSPRLPRIATWDTPPNSGDLLPSNDDALPNPNEHKEIEIDEVDDHDENHDSNAPLYLSHHTLMEQQKKRHQRHASSPQKVELSADFGNRRVSSPELSPHISASDRSIVSSQHHLSPNHSARRLHHGSSSRSKNKYSKMLSSHHLRNPSSSSRYAQNNETDKLQRKLQKLEQDMLSKNIQHDIMVNKEEMMAKRIKLSDTMRYTKRLSE